MTLNVKRIRADAHSPVATSHSLNVAEIAPIENVGKVVPIGDSSVHLLSRANITDL